MRLKLSHRRVRLQCSCADGATIYMRRWRNTKRPPRFRTEENDAVGLQRIGPIGGRIVTTSVLISARRLNPAVEMSGV